MGNVISWILSNIGQDERQGEAREENQPRSLAGMINTLVPMIVIAVISLVVFLTTRRAQKRFYAPRIYLGSLQDHERNPELPDGLFRWISTFSKIPDVYALKHQSLDAYLFLRYLRVCTTICFVSMCITWPILLPIHATGGNGKSQLEVISYSNINIETSKNRLFAHALLAWLVYGFFMYMITRECIFYINIRQAYLLNDQSTSRPSSRTVLFTCVPHEYLNETRIRDIFGSDVVRNVWIGGNSRSLDRLVKKRDEVAMMLERSEVELIKRVNKHQMKMSKKAAGIIFDTLQDQEGQDTFYEHIQTLRPSHRLGPLGLFGKKVDTIDWCRAKLGTPIPLSEAAQEMWRDGNFKKMPAVFVEFQKQSDAETAFQVVTHHHALSMAPKYIGIRPGEIIWSSMTIPWWQILIREYIVYAFIAALILWWAIPVGIFGIIAQVNVLQSLPGLTWIKDIPDKILGVISGLLPSAALAYIMSLVPGILRFCARFSGLVSRAEIELFTQSGFFMFQLVQVFLIRTITDTAATAIIQIVQSPTRVFSVLAEALPTSSNFYMAYFIVEGLAIAVDVTTQVVSCLVFNLIYRLFLRTPRSMYKKWTTLTPISWGGTLPVYTGIVVISITYAVIAPFLLVWSTLGIGIFYQSYRYNLLFVASVEVDTRGLMYPKALKQLFAGIYLAEVCLIGMFLVSKAFAQAGLIIALLVFSILYQISLGRALNPLLYNLPRTLQAEEEKAKRNDSFATEEGLKVNEGWTSRTPTNRTYTKPKKVNSYPSDKKVQKQGGSFFIKFLKPWEFSDYWTLRKLMVHNNIFEVHVPEEPSADSSSYSPYWPPSVSSPAPLLWIPEDAAGVSKREIAQTSKVIPITDEGCTLNEKNKIIWDTASARPPIWERRVYH
ncbi:unnamed protein product [Clonostachys rosea]|uniref:CSC1/OSCA1-like 7TM region domain-containing protein n=1 Tax=Bionectria ochroleuca TaxID=29856 RepID=A0ABY6UVY2_BIOOC|nr:unnamed protein product [Clonostachys rosea]